MVGRGWHGDIKFLGLPHQNVVSIVSGPTQYIAQLVFYSDTFYIGR